MGRLLYHRHIINTRGESWRLREKKRRSICYTISISLHRSLERLNTRALGFAIVLMDYDPDDAAAEVWKDKTKRLDASFLLVLVRSRLAAQLQVRGKGSMGSRTAIASWWKRPGRVNSELAW